MKDKLIPRLAVVMVGAMLGLLLTAGLAGAQPPIPHPLKGRARCTVCHATGVATAPRYPPDHAGRGDETCTQCHVALVSLATPAPGQPPPVVAPGAPPPIPHTLVGREHCLACHAKGVGGAPIIPPDHEGRTNDICQGCHKPGEAVTPTPTAPAGPAPTPVALPTLIIHPPAGERDSCVECHLSLGGIQTEITVAWQESVHAGVKVSCADCHGGDPRTDNINEAMSPAAGYIGVPTREDIPGVCGGCHSDVERMRQYRLPTDQYIQYLDSVHGQRLKEAGDPNVATCVDCHGTHDVKEASDPSSDVYPPNVPDMCARCHAHQALMEPYGIPTNQYDLFKESVHGQALLVKQDLRAPNCATCHGKHGAAPPGFTEVAHVCGSCHTATEDYYERSRHAKIGEAGPKCITCHGYHDVTKPDETLFVGPEERHCGSCHAPGSTIGTQVMALQNTIVGAAQLYQEAEETIRQAASLGMIVSAEEAKLAEAHTNLTTARAAQHTTQLPVVAELTDAAKAAAQAAQEGAAQKIAETIFRRRAMVVAVAAIGVTIGALYSIKRELDRQLERR